VDRQMKTAPPAPATVTSQQSGTKKVDIHKNNRVF